MTNTEAEHGMFHRQADLGKDLGDQEKSTRCRVSVTLCQPPVRHRACPTVKVRQRSVGLILKQRQNYRTCSQVTLKGDSYVIKTFSRNLSTTGCGEMLIFFVTLRSHIINGCFRCRITQNDALHPELFWHILVNNWIYDFLHSSISVLLSGRVKLLHNTETAPNWYIVIAWPWES